MSVDTNSAFIPGTFIQCAWDSTSLGLLKTCPRKYYYTIIEEWRSKHESFHLTFGILFHKGLETYDRAKFLGADHNAASRAAIRIVLEGSWKDNKPWESGDTRKNRFTLVRSIVWYLEQFKDDPCETIRLRDGNPAVELSFRMELDHLTPDGQPYILCGHLDRLVKFNSDLYGMDRKTTGSALGSRFFDRFSPDNQMSLYTFAGNIILNTPIKGMIVDGVECAVGFNRYQRGFVHRTKSQLEEWTKDFSNFITIAEGYAKSQYWPQNDTACDKYGGCPFREVCSKDPSVRPEFLEADFIKQQWNPLSTREV